MKVWRVAHESATYMGFPTGPYCQIDTIPEAQTVENLLEGMFAAHVDDSHLSPGADCTLGFIESPERCGFDSLEALDDWFDGYHGVLSRCGFIIFVYEVPDDAVRVGQVGQVLFLYHRAEEIGTESLTAAIQLELFAVEPPAGVQEARDFINDNRGNL